MFRIVSIFKLKIRHRIFVSLLSNSRDPAKAFSCKLVRYFPKQTLLALEALDKNLASRELFPIIQVITEEFLFNYAIKKSRSVFWKMRNYALRIFLLRPDKSHEKSAIDLLSDRVQINREIAALLLIKLESKKGIEAIINSMNPLKSYSYFFFLNLFLNFPKQSLPSVIELLHNHPSDALLSGSLEILSGVRDPLEIEIDTSLFETKCDRVQIAIAKFCASQPSKKYEKYLISFLESKKSSCVIETIKALGSYKSEKSINALLDFAQKKDEKISQAAIKSLYKSDQGLKALNHLKNDRVANFLIYIKTFHPT